jgi:WhiB family transcriptional regulator, redox-sensing transcriptional regulator
LTSALLVKVFTSGAEMSCTPRTTGQTSTTELEIPDKEASMDWRHRALCRDEDPELFFPIGNTGPALLQVEEAKAVCRRCPVTDECLSWALESGQDAGVWGAMSEDERRALKRRRARARARMA